MLDAHELRRRALGGPAGEPDRDDHLARFIRHEFSERPSTPCSRAHLPAVRPAALAAFKHARRVPLVDDLPPSRATLTQTMVSITPASLTGHLAPDGLAPGAPARTLPVMLTIRDAGAADADSIVRLLGELGHPAHALTHVHAALATREPHAVTLVAVRGGEVVGVASGVVSRVLEYPAPQLRISAIAVDALCRRAGVGLALVRALEARARALGCFRVELTSARSLAGAHAFWRAAGYDETGVRFVRRLDG